jgi:hypothetical protein
VNNHLFALMETEGEGIAEFHILDIEKQGSDMLSVYLLGNC